MTSRAQLRACAPPKWLGQSKAICETTATGESVCRVCAGRILADTPIFHAMFELPSHVRCGFLLEGERKDLILVALGRSIFPGPWGRFATWGLVNRAGITEKGRRVLAVVPEDAP